VLVSLFFHLFAVVAMTVVMSVVLMWRYAVRVRKDMEAIGPVTLSVMPGRPPLQGIATLTMEEVDGAAIRPAAAHAAIVKERSTRRAIVIAYLCSTATAALVIALVTLQVEQIEVTSSRLVALTGATMGVAVPMIAVSVAWPFWRALVVWLGLQLGVAALTVIVPMITRVIRHGEFDPTLVTNAVYLFQWIIVSLTPPFVMAFATSVRRLRGPAPVSLALISVVGLVPLLSAKGAEQFVLGDDVSLRIVAVTALMYVAFFIAAPFAGWVAWRALKALANGYDAKRFSDAQLLACAWWLIFVATLLADVGLEPQVSAWALLLAGGFAFALFAGLSSALLRLGTRHTAAAPRPILLLLRLFGKTSRSQRFFDRVISRWRLIGPVTVIAAPDILARTFDPVDLMQFATGRTGEAFVQSQAQLDDRLARLDVEPDPDGRYRVTEFWCHSNSWQATVIALMARCDAVVVDVRGLSAERAGVRFELEQLATRLTADRIVLVVDSATDRDVLTRSIGPAHGTLRLVHAERNSAVETRRVFETLLAATGVPSP